MEYFDSQGKKATRKAKITHYHNSSGDLIQIPTMADTREEIMDYLEVCISAKHPWVSRAELEDIWDRQKKSLDPILEYLEILRDKYAEEEDRWRMITYNKALRALRGVDVPIVSGKQAQKIRGIGAGIGKKIDEIIKTGGLRLVDVEGPEVRKRTDKSQVMKLFKSIWGVGDAKAKRWYAQGYRSLKDIRDHEYRSLTKPQRMTLDFHEQLSHRISRETIEDIKLILEAHLYAIDDQSRLEIAGSYRRGAKESGDIDILVSSEEFGRGIMEPYIESLEIDGTIIYILGKTKKKYTTLVQYVGGGVVKADFFYVPWKSWGTALVAWTGSGDYVRNMREKASRMGYKLSEDQLVVRKTGKIIPTPTERSVFKALKMKYVPPQKRY